MICGVGTSLEIAEGLANFLFHAFQTKQHITLEFNRKLEFVDVCDVKVLYLLVEIHKKMRMELLEIMVP